MQTAGIAISIGGVLVAFLFIIRNELWQFNGTRLLYRHYLSLWLCITLTTGMLLMVQPIALCFAIGVPVGLLFVPYTVRAGRASLDKYFDGVRVVYPTARDWRRFSRFLVRWLLTVFGAYLVSAVYTRYDVAISIAIVMLSTIWLISALCAVRDVLTIEQISGKPLLEVQLPQGESASRFQRS